MYQAIDALSQILQSFFPIFHTGRTLHVNFLFQLFIQDGYFNINYFSNKSKLDNHQQQFNYWLVFREINFGNLSLATNYQLSAINTTAHNFKHPFTFYAPAIRGHNNLRHFLPYLLLCNVSKLFLYYLMPLLSWLIIWLAPSFIKVLWFPSVVFFYLAT